MTLPRERETDGLSFNKNDTAVEAIVRAARECAISDHNPDTCGVCHKHFHECEEEKSSHDDSLFNDNFFFSCPGARVREALARHDEATGAINKEEKTK